MTLAPQELPLEGVREVLAELGQPAPAVSATRIPGGASREAWLIEAGADGKAPRYVLRRDPPGAPPSAISQQAEFEVVRAALAAGVPAPRPLHYEPEGGRFGSAGFLMDFVPGESIGRRLIRRPEFAKARERLPAQLAQALARIHAMPLGPLSEWAGEPPDDPGVAAIQLWEQVLDAVGEPLPVVELGLRWLRANLPAPAPATLVHGDFRLGNFLVSEEGLAAVIDWELTHPGDPAEDIGWLCIRSWRFGEDARRVAGVGGLDEFLAAYAAAGGAQISVERVRYWEVFGNVKWAVICAQQAQRHLSGAERSLELASLGRRVCEPEWDLLELIRAAA